MKAWFGWGWGGRDGVRVAKVSYTDTAYAHMTDPNNTPVHEGSARLLWLVTLHTCCGMSLPRDFGSSPCDSTGRAIAGSLCPVSPGLGPTHLCTTLVFGLYPSSVINHTHENNSYSVSPLREPSNRKVVLGTAFITSIFIFF